MDIFLFLIFVFCVFFIGVVLSFYFHIKHLIETYYWLQRSHSALADMFYSRFSRFERWFFDRL